MPVLLMVIAILRSVVVGIKTGVGQRVSRLLTLVSSEGVGVFVVIRAAVTVGRP